MQLGEILDRKGHQVFAVRPEWSLHEAAAVIARRNIGTTVVTDPKGALVGIISERDIVRALTEAGTGVFDLSVGTVMTAAVMTCPPEATVGEALSLMASHRIRHVPVVRNNAVIGLISIRDILEFRLESLEENFASLLNGKREAARARDAGLRADRAAADFLVGLGDRMKPQLHAITDLSEYLCDRLFEVPGACNHLPDIAEIGANGRAALATLDHALDLARVASNQREPEREDIEVARLIAGCADAAREPAALKGVAIEVAADDTTPALAADRLMVCQMLDHLLSNAVKFTPSGGTVSIGCTAGRDGGVRLVVTDSGIGMAPEQLAKVIQPFYQVERLTMQRSQRGDTGAGLGLALVEAMMRAHDGSLRLESRAGIGTVATLRFPPAPLLALPRHAEAAD